MALANCTGTPGVNIVASAGETCFASGTYSSTNLIAGQATGIGSVLSNSPEGANTVLFSTSAANTPAVQADTGGQVTLTAVPPYAAVTVSTIGNSSIGLYATGTVSTDGGPVASSINVQNANISTTGDYANGVQADSGGQVTLTNGTVTTSGISNTAVYATGTSSKITATGVSVTASGLSNGNYSSNGIAANSGATMSFTGGSVTTSGNFAVGVTASNGGSVTISGTTVTAGVAGGPTGNGDGSQGLFVTGTGSVMNASGLTIQSAGSYDPVHQVDAGGASNNGYGGVPNGGTLNLSNSSINTTGTQAYGVYTANGGVTTLTSDTITGPGAGSSGVLDYSGGQTTISGGSVTVGQTGVTASGFGVHADGSGSSLDMTDVQVTTNGDANPSTGTGVNTVSVTNGASATISGGTITANGLANSGLEMNSSGAATVVTLNNGASIQTTGAGATAVNMGANTTLNATGITIATIGVLRHERHLRRPRSLQRWRRSHLHELHPDDDGRRSHAIMTQGGTTTINGGMVSTSGQYAIGLLSTGGGLSIATNTTGTAR